MVGRKIEGFFFSLLEYLLLATNLFSWQSQNYNCDTATSSVVVVLFWGVSEPLHGVPRYYSHDIVRLRN
jgi:hypothetical protein